LTQADAVATDVTDQKWHHVALTYAAGDINAYLDGKLIITDTSTVARATTQDLRIGFGRDQRNADTYFSGSLDEWRIWNDVRTPTEIRANMFKQVDGTGVSLTATGLVRSYTMNEGSGYALNDAQNNLTDVNVTTYDGDGATNDLWAGAGTFDIGSGPTLVMAKSGTQTISYLKDETFGKLTINAGSTTNLFGVDETTAELRVVDDLNIAGTLASTASEYINFNNDFVSNSGTITIGGTVSGLYKFRTQHTSGTVTFPASGNVTTPRIICDGSGGTVTAGGDLTITEKLQIDSGTTFNANGNTIACKYVDVNGGTLNLSNSTLNFSVTSDADAFDMNDASTLTAGPTTTITGYSSTSKTSALLPSAGGFEVVGDIKWLKLYSGGDLTVIGAVIDCELQDSTANIRQWHHTLDTQQLLDADSGGDDDLKLAHPALDNALELMTG